MPRQLILALALAALLPALGLPAAAADSAPASGTESRLVSQAVADLEPADAHAAPAHGAAGDPNILEAQPSLAIWTVVVFVGLLLVLSRFAWKPLLEALHQREVHLEHVLHDTERARNEAEGLLGEHRKLMAEAQEKVRAMLEEARREAQGAADEILKKAQVEAETARQRAERDIATARDQALVELWSKSAELAVSVAGRVLARDLGPDDHRRLIATAVAELPSGPVVDNSHARGGAPA
jgi:F-type H+-transporting ATPase subunit b